MPRLFIWLIANPSTLSSLLTAGISLFIALLAIAASASFPISPNSLLRAADQPSRQENQNAAHNHLKRRLQKRRIHGSGPKVTDDHQLDCNNDHCTQHSDMKIGD